MSVRILVILLSGFALPFVAAAQDVIAIEGRVVDARGREPLAGATVALKRSGETLRGTITDAEGRFAIQRDGMAAGDAILEVRFVGYESRELPIQILADVSTDLRIELRSVSFTLAALEIIGESAGVYRKLPGAATKLSSQTVDMIAPIGTQELLGYVAGIHSFADDGIGNSRISIGIRGLNPRRSARVLILEDGIPIQPALYLYPNMYYNPPVERIDRVEVIKGSAAIKYGPQTMGGVVNYITSRPRASLGTNGQVTTGTNGFISLFTEMGGWGNATLKPEIQLLFKRGDGFRQNNDFQQYNGTVKLSYVPDADRVYYVKANVDFENSKATYTGLTEYTFEHDPNFNPKDDDVFDVFRSSLDLIRTTSFSSHRSTTTRAYASYFDRRWWREFDVFERPGEFDLKVPSTIDPVPWYTSGNLVRIGGGERNFGNLRTFYTAGLEHIYELDHVLAGAASHLTAGARVHWERFIDDKKIGESPGDRDGIYFRGDPDDPTSLQIVGQSHHYESTALALFAEEDLRFGSLSVVPGIRVEVFEQERINRLDGARYEDKTSAVVLPGLGLNYGVGSFNLFGGIHRGYTPPSSGTLTIVQFGDLADDSGLDLRSEKSWNMEIGIRGVLPWMEFEAAGFHLAIEDIVAAGPGTAFKNLGRTRNYGLELSGRIAASSFASVLPDLNVSYTYLQTEVLDGRIESALRAGVIVDIAGKELPYAPRHSLAAGIEKNLDMGLSLRADVRFVDRVYTDFENIETTSNRGDTGPVPAYTVLDASVRYRVNDRLSVIVIGKNLLDEVYIGSRLHSNPGLPEAHLSSGIIPGPRRQINLALRYRY